MSIMNLSAAQLERAVEIRKEIARLEAELQSLDEASKQIGKPRRSKLSLAAKAVAKAEAQPEKPTKRRKISRAGRAAISAAARERWAKKRAEKAASK